MFYKLLNDTKLYVTRTVCHQGHENCMLLTCHVRVSDWIHTLCFTWMSKNSLLEAGAISKWLSVRLRTKWLWVRILLLSMKLRILENQRLFGNFQSSMRTQSSALSPLDKCISGTSSRKLRKSRHQSLLVLSGFAYFFFAFWILSRQNSKLESPFRHFWMRVVISS